MYLAHAVVGYSVGEITTAFGSDWTAVYHAIRKIEHQIEVDLEAADAVAQLRAHPRARPTLGRDGVAK